MWDAGFRGGKKKVMVVWPGGEVGGGGEEGLGGYGTYVCMHASCRHISPFY